jgi:peptide/nickel transport system permease protein
MGLDRPLISQFGTFLGHVATGHWGKSWTSQQPVLREISDHLGPTLSLCFLASLYSIAAALVVNTLVFWGPRMGRGLIPVLRLGIALPSFVGGNDAALATARIQSWTSAGGVLGGGDSPLGYVLPGVAVSLYPACVMTTLLRDRFANILSSPFFRTARAVGYSRCELLWRVLLRNSWPTLLTAWVNQISLLVFSTIIVEYVFSFRGLGTLLASSIQSKDLPVLTGIILLNGLFFLCVQTISNRLLRPCRAEANEPVSAQPALQPI